MRLTQAQLRLMFSRQSLTQLWSLHSLLGYTVSGLTVLEWMDLGNLRDYLRAVCGLLIHRQADAALENGLLLIAAWWLRA